MTDLIEKFTSAAFLGDERALKQILDLNQDKSFINGVNQRGQTALYCAARGSEQGHFNCLLTLLNIPSVGVDIPIGTHQGTSLHAACFACNPQSVAALLYRGANAFARNLAGLMPIDDIPSSHERAAETREIFQIYKNKKLPGLLEYYPILNNIILRIDLMRSTKSPNQLNINNNNKDDKVKKFTTREEGEMRKILISDSNVQNQLKYKIRKEVRYDLSHLRKEIVNPPLIVDVLPQIFPGGELKKKWRYKLSDL